jgi:uncharacterized protein YkwD
MRLTLALLVFAAATALPPAPAAGAIAPAPAAPAAGGLSAQERREVLDLVNQFRRAAGDDEARGKIVDRILTMGGTAPAQLLAQVNKELAPLQAKYRADFYKAAGQTLRDRLKEHNPSEIETLRASVLALSKDEGLTKEKIQATGDPAVAKLAEWLTLTPDAVHAAAPALAAQRTAMLALGAYADRLARAAAPPKPDAAAPLSFEEQVSVDEKTSALMTLATNDRDRKVLMENTRLEPQLGAEEAAGILDLNRIRLLLGLKVLAIDVKLCEAARDHSKDMVEKSFFAHDSPVPGKKTPWDRAKRAGTSAGAENIAAGAATGAATNQQWFHSPGHHKNMLGNHSRMGLGRFKNTWTQMFG